MPSFYDLMMSAVAAGEPFALGIISAVKGSSPQKQGAKAIFFADGRIEGTLGGGCLEAEIRERARLALLKQEPATFDLVLDHDFGWDDGLICGGKVFGLIIPSAPRAEMIWRELALRERTRTWGVRKDFSIAWVNDEKPYEWLYREAVRPPCALWIAGSGHVAQAVAPLAAQLDFEVTVFDDRPALVNHENFPRSTILRVDYWEKLLKEPLSERPTFGLIVTRGHQHDALVLREWVRRPFAFLGMIGSNRKKRVIFARFLEEKLATEEELSRVMCPVGLDIHSVTVPEIALSVMAQLVQRRARLLNAGISVKFPASKL